MDIPSDISHQAMGYDRTATMFSPEGHLLQMEYAEKAVRLGVSSIGMVCTDGVFILADKRIRDKLIIPESATRIWRNMNSMWEGFTIGLNITRPPLNASKGF